MSKCRRRCLLICFSSGLDRNDTIEIGRYFDGFTVSRLVQGSNFGYFESIGKSTFHYAEIEDIIM